MGGYLIFKIEVSGESAWPELVAGRHYWASSLLRIKPGRFVVFRNPNNLSETFVKRVKSIEKDGHRVESTVSWGSGPDLGIIKNSLILGRIIGK